MQSLRSKNKNSFIKCDKNIELGYTHLTMSYNGVGRKYIWPRVGAMIIDGVFIGILYSTVGAFLGMALNVPSNVFGSVSSILLLLLLAYLESHFGATPGKSLFNLSVQDLHGQKLGFGKALLRLFLKDVVFMLFFLPLTGLLAFSLFATFFSAASTSASIYTQAAPIITQSSYSTSYSSGYSTSSTSSYGDTSKYKTPSIAVRDSSGSLSKREQGTAVKNIASIALFFLTPFALIIPLVILFRLVNKDGQTLYDRWAGATVIGKHEIPGDNGVSGPFDAIDSLQKLSQLKGKGAITTAEFEEQKAALLRRM
jgi:uncharacterized RDD family membrane protein YckC